MTTLYEIIKNYEDFSQSTNVYSAKDADIKVYVIVNTTPKLSKGKIAAQVGHAIQELTTIMQRNKKRWRIYQHNGCAKIILGADEETIKYVLDNTQNKMKVYIIDAGKTECLPNTVTAVGYLPMYPHEVPKVFKELKLL